MIPARALCLLTLLLPAPAWASGQCDPLWHIAQARIWDRPADPFNDAQKIAGMERSAAMACLTARGYRCTATTCSKTTTQRESTADILFGKRAADQPGVLGPRRVTRFTYTVTFPDPILTDPDRITGHVARASTVVPWYRSKAAADFGATQ
ncbi:MAG: hypothetical protein AAFN94_07915 [Pseudomonadota bacterium]